MTPNSSETVKTTPLLERIDIEELFGQYSYHIDTRDKESLDNPGPKRLILLYGDNGSGKTTVLQLVWHLLSPAESRGHRTAIARTPFRRLRVQLSDGKTIVATKMANLQGDYQMEVIEDGQPTVTVNFTVDDKMTIKKSSSGTFVLKAGDIVAPSARRIAGRRNPRKHANDDRDYLDFLQRVNLSPLFLADDRNIYSDEFDPEELSAEERRYAADLITGLGSNTPELARRSIARALESCINRVNDWLRRLTLGGQTVGSTDANKVYMGLLETLASGFDNNLREATEVDMARLSERIHRIEERTSEFENLGLVPHFNADEYLQILPLLKNDRKRIAFDVLTPYFDSLQARLNALQEAQTIITTFLGQVNRFLTRKSMSFRPSEGLSIKTDDGVELNPEMLSSGERQLVLLLCNTVLARRSARLFIIDEPELSLNVKWQRDLLDALLACTEGTGVQFLVATHSIEMVTGHRDSLVRLEESRS